MPWSNCRCDLIECVQDNHWISYPQNLPLCQAAGGHKLFLVIGARDVKPLIPEEEQMIKKSKWVGIVNNASAISLIKTLDTEMKHYDLMHEIN